MVIYNLFTSVVVLNSFVLGSAVQSPVIYFAGLAVLQIAGSDSVKTILKGAWCS